MFTRFDPKAGGVPGELNSRPNPKWHNEFRSTAHGGGSRCHVTTYGARSIRPGHHPPFSLDGEEYDDLKAWWLASHPGDVEDDLGVATWDEWVDQILDP